MEPPMLPPAPARLSTMTDWPSSVVSAWPMMRARMSVVPPAAKGTTMVTGLLGKACAIAALLPSRPAPAMAAMPAQAAADSAKRRVVWMERVMVCLLQEGG
ncbi:hypothetical protein D3C72_2022530 [compost metagenome]